MENIPHGLIILIGPSGLISYQVDGYDYWLGPP